MAEITPTPSSDGLQLAVSPQDIADGLYLLAEEQVLNAEGPGAVQAVLMTAEALEEVEKAKEQS